MSDIRVTYSGLIGLVVGLVSIFTGLIFTLIITRTLTPEEYGTWSLIGSMIAYFIISEIIVSHWTLRQIARGEDVGKTAVSTSLGFSLGAIPIYILYVTVVSTQNVVEVNLMMLGAIILPVFFVSQTLESINRGHKPHAKSFSMLTFETLKIPGVLAFVFFFDFGVVGVIIALIIAYIIKIGVQLYFARSKLRGIFQTETIKRWFKLSWIPLYYTLHRFITNIDIVLYSVITGSVIGLAFYHAAFIIAGIISSSGLVSQALLPKLLSGGSSKHIEDNFRLLLYFAIPLMTLAIIFSKPTLFALNPLYKDAFVIVIFLSFKTFLAIINTIFYNILTGLETVDIEKNPAFSKLIKSKLFSVPSIALVHSIVYIAVLIITLVTLNAYGFEELEIVEWWAIVAFVSFIPVSVYLWYQVRKLVTFSFPYTSVAKFSIASVASGIVFFATSDYIITYEQSIYDFLPGLLLQAAICVGVYLGITFLIDSKTRNLFKSILKAISF